LRLFPFFELALSEKYLLALTIDGNLFALTLLERLVDARPCLLSNDADSALNSNAGEPLNQALRLWFTMADNLMAGLGFSRAGRRFALAAVFLKRLSRVKTKVADFFVV
jgi:hypothetical protein